MLCVSLKIIVDKPLSIGQFPDKWKVAFVTPILKTNHLAICRAIAKISIIYKLFERNVAHKLLFLVKRYISTS